MRTLVPSGHRGPENNKESKMNENKVTSEITVMNITGVAFEVRSTIRAYDNYEYGTKTGRVVVNQNRHHVFNTNDSDFRKNIAHIINAIDPTILNEQEWSLRKSASKDRSFNLVSKIDREFHLDIRLEFHEVGGFAADEAREQAFREECAALEQVRQDRRDAALAKGIALMDDNAHLRITSCEVEVDGFVFTVSRSIWNDKVTTEIRNYDATNERFDSRMGGYVVKPNTTIYPTLAEQAAKAHDELVMC
jgi:hypothetical protein